MKVGEQRGHVNTVVQILDSLTHAAQAERTDGQLLDLFVRLRDEEGFAAIVRRHGPMVRGVCFRVLRNPADADDAFQAAFLVLARKAATIGTRHRLAQWLYGVAYNTARKLREANTRRAKRECPLATVTEPSAVPTDARDEWLAVLDDELSRISERYREVIVLCDLEGLTRRETAKALGCPEGTVAGRLARARQLLAARLTARGVVPVATVLALLTERGATAVPPSVFASVIRAVSIDSLAHAAASGLISRRVADTTEGVLRTMFASKLRAIASIVLCGGLALVCCVGAFHFASAQPAPEPTDALASADDKPEPEKPPAKPADEPQKTLTMFPLKKLEPDATAKVISDAYKGKGVTVTALPADRALMVYASEPHTTEIGSLLQSLGESAPKNAVVIQLKKGADAAEEADLLRRLFRKDAVIVPAPNENALLVYVTDADLKTIRQILVQKRILADPPKHTRAPLTPALPAEKMLSLHFDNVAWKDVLDWYAKETGLTMITTVTPTGRVTIRPGKDRKLTIAEVTDLINELLAQQKFILIRRHLTFFIHPADEKIDPTLVPRVDLSELPRFGRIEIVQILLPVKGMGTGGAQDELKKLLSPFGQMVVLEKSNAILILDTAGNIDRIVRILQTLGRLGEPQPPKAEPVLKTYTLTKLKADEVAGQLAVALPQMRITPLTAQNQIMALGTPDDQARLARYVLVLEADQRIIPSNAIPDPRAAPPAAKKFPFRMKNATWDDVFDTYAKLSGLSPVIRLKLTGTFTCEPASGREFTLAEITDLINEGLAQQKVILIRREKTFVLHPADEKPDGSYFARVTPAELAGRGRTELVEVSITLKGPSLKEVDTEVVKSDLNELLTPFGAIVFAKGNVFVIRDKVGNVSRILETLEMHKLLDSPKPSTEPNKPEKMYSIQFEKVAWKHVFTWYAAESGLTRSDSIDLPGVVTLTPPAGKKFTLTELTDLINDALLVEKHLLIRSKETFVIVPADKRVDPALVPAVSVKELSKRGRTELVRVSFPMKGVAGKDAATVRDQLKTTLSPFGRSMLTGRNELIVTDLAGNLVKIKEMIDALSTEKK